jgi:O-antigen/teichoic acid export membrane protein
VNPENPRKDTDRLAIRSVSLGAGLRLLRWPFVFLSAIFIPRMMDEVLYGRYALFLSIFFLADSVTDVGILHVFGRYIPGEDTPATEFRRRLLLRGFLWIGVLLSCLSGLVIVGLVNFFPGEFFPGDWVAPLFLLLVFARIDGILFSFLYGLNRITRYSFRDVLRSMLLFVFVLVSFRYFGLIGALWSLVLKEFLVLLFGLYWTKDYVFQSATISWGGLKSYIFFGCSFYLPMLLFGFMQRSGAVFIHGMTQSPEFVGHFDIANQFFLMTVSFLGVILVTLLPSMTAHREQNDNDTIHRWHANIMGYCGVTLFFMFNALAWFGDPAVVFFLGPGFAPVRDLSLIMLLAMVPGLIIYVGMNYAVLDKESHVYVGGVMTGTVVMVLGCYFLIPHWQAAGAAWATVAGHAVLATFFGFRYREALGQALRGFFKALLLGVLFVPILWIETDLRQGILYFLMTSSIYAGLVISARILDLSLLFQYIKKAFEFFARGCKG